MGLRYPFDYVGYEEISLRTLLALLDDYCTSCHTNKHFTNGCKDCEIGALIYKTKDYLLTTSLSTSLKTENSIIENIREQLKDLEPSPLYNNQFVFDKCYHSDILSPLRELLLALQHERNRRDFLYIWDTKFRKLVELRLEHELKRDEDESLKNAQKDIEEKDYMQTHNPD